MRCSFSGPNQADQLGKAHFKLKIRLPVWDARRDILSAGSPHSGLNPRAVLLAHHCNLSLSIGKVLLPGDEDLQNLAVRLKKKGDRLKLSKLDFQTSRGGKFSSEGAFSLLEGRLSAPSLKMKLHYKVLNWQSLLSLLTDLGNIKDNLAGKNRAAKPLRLSDYRVSLKIKAKKVIYQALTAGELNLKLKLKKGQAHLERLSLQVFGGHLDAEGDVQLRGNASYPLRLHAHLRHLDLNQLFSAAEPLRLDVLRGDNIRGSMDGWLAIHAEMDSSFLPSFSRTTVYANAVIRQLELIGVEPIQKALHFMKESKTRHLYFEEVATRFLLSRNRFLMPGMNLNNNITYLDLLGSYTLNKEADLYLDVSLLDLLLGGNQRRIDRIQNQKRTHHDGRLKKHLSVSREQGAYKVRLVNKKSHEKARAMVRNAFKDELRRQQVDTTFSLLPVPGDHP